MRGLIKQKWRPSLALVIGGTLVAVLAAPAFGILLLRLLADDLGWWQSVPLVGAGVALVALVLGYLLWRLILGPVRKLAAQSEAMAAGQTSLYDPQSHYGTRELQELGQSVLDMAHGLHNRQETVRSYSNHVTHELKSPLTALIGAVELLQTGGLSGDQRDQLLQTLRGSADRMQLLLEGMREIAMAREPLGVETSNVNEVMLRMDMYSSDLAINLIDTQHFLPIPVKGLEIILMQLLGNAVCHGAKEVWITCGSDPAMLRISDNGDGISKGNISRLFEPFFTTRRKDGGTGMGLAIVRSLLEVRGGGIEVLDSDQGAVFEIRF